MNYKGIVAVIIAGTLGGSLMMAVIYISWQHQPLSQQGAEVVISIISGLLVALGYYMGGKNGENNH